MAAIPSVGAALETYLGFLETSSSATEREAVATPNIDRILHGYQWQLEKGRKQMGQNGRRKQDKDVREGVGGASSTTPDHGGSDKDDRAVYESRLMQLEKQLSQLLQQNKNARKKSSTARQQPPHTPDVESEDSPSSSSEEVATPPPLVKNSQQKTHKHRTKVASISAVKQITGSSHQRRDIVRERRKLQRDSAVSEKKKMLGCDEWDRDGRRRSVSSVTVVREDCREKEGGRTERVTTVQEDKKMKAQLVMDTQEKIMTETTQINQELEEEREQRMKAERAASRLVEHVRTLQTQLENSSREREQSIIRITKIDSELKTEREKRVTNEKDGEKLQESLVAAQSELEAVRERLEEQKITLREKEAEMINREASYNEKKTELLGHLKAAELTSSGHKKEAEIVQFSLAEMKRQLQQMQELLATREREHQRAIENYKPLDGREVQDLVTSRVQQERVRMEELIEQHKQRLTEQQKAYQSLEDEFRMALRIEASRYQELRECYDGVQSQIEGYQTTAEAALKKEQRATQMVSELTAIVREQKGRLVELTRAKQDTLQELKKRVRDLESNVREKHKLEVIVQTLQEENSRLSSQLSAQESVVDGLRGERQLWGRELAQQGAELAQDRGRMEAQIEALSNETTSLRDDLQHARDSVRIKEKVISDQQATISQLRETLAVREREMEEMRLDWEQEQQSLQLQIEQERESSTHMQNELSTLAERKGQLKEELATVRDELLQWKNKYSKLKSEWEERVKVIGDLENSLTQVQDTFSQREAVLVKEKEELLVRVKSVEERLRECEDTHSRQVGEQKRSHDSHMTQLTQEKDIEIEKANRKVCAVENEMRDLLAEVTKEKRVMEARAHRMSLTLHQLQQEFTH